MLDEAGMQGKDLAKKLGVHHVTVSNWRRGDTPIDQRTAIAIEAILAKQGQSRASRPAKGGR